MLNQAISGELNRWRRTAMKFGRFAAVGAAATGVQYLLLILLVRYAHLHPVIASDIGFVTSAVLNYLLNYHLTFRSSKAHVDSGPKFVLVAGLGLALNSLVMHLGTTVVGAHHLLTQVVATGGVAVWNFTGHQLWSFGHGPVEVASIRGETQ